MRIKLYVLTDENSVPLVDESGNYIAASVQITDYLTSAYASQFILHGYAGTGYYNKFDKTFYLVDESGNYLVDETAKYLTARITIFANLLHAESTITLLHGG